MFNLRQRMSFGLQSSCAHAVKRLYPRLPNPCLRITPFFMQICADTHAADAVHPIQLLARAYHLGEGHK
jgi:hypothetical protein